MPPPMDLPMTKMSGCSPTPGGPARAGRERVRLVDHQQRAVPRASSRSPSMKPGSGSTMPMLVSAGSVRMAATSPWASASSTAARSFHVTDRVVRSRSTGGRRCRAALRCAVRPGQGEGLVDGAVVAVREDQHLGSTGGQPGQPDRPAVGVGGAQGEGPERQAEPARQLGAHPLRVLGGEHRRDAAELAHPAAHRGDGGGGGVAGHGPGVAEREVDVGVAVHIGDPVAPGVVEVEREPAGPHVHPRHRHPAEEVARLLKRARLRGWLSVYAACSASRRVASRVRSRDAMDAG